MKEGETAGGRGDADRAEWMGEGLFVHASNSLGVISIACSIIVPFEEGTKKKRKAHDIESFLSVTWSGAEGFEVCDPRGHRFGTY